MNTIYNTSNANTSGGESITVHDLDEEDLEVVDCWEDDEDSSKIAKANETCAKDQVNTVEEAIDSDGDSDKTVLFQDLTTNDDPVEILPIIEVNGERMNVEQKVENFLKDVSKAHTSANKEKRKRPVARDINVSFRPANADSTVICNTGDLPPGVDIDQAGRDTTTESLVKNLTNHQDVKSNADSTVYSRPYYEIADQPINSAQEEVQFRTSRHVYTVGKNNNLKLEEREEGLNRPVRSKSRSPRRRRKKSRSPLSKQKRRTSPCRRNRSPHFKRGTNSPLSAGRGRHSRQTRSPSRSPVRHRPKFSRSRSISPGRRKSYRRSRSKSTSRSPERFRKRKEPASPNEDKKPKRVRKIKSPLRVGSWRPPVNQTEWPVQDSQSKLEKDMDKFIASNYAATRMHNTSGSSLENSFPPVIRHEVPLHNDNLSTDKFEEVVMPIPPPPPDISELLKMEEQDQSVNANPLSSGVWLSSLLESAISEQAKQAKKKTVLDRCKAAIYRLQEVCKPGRFTVSPSQETPYQSRSQMKPGQSILHRSCSKIQFDYSKMPKNPVLRRKETIAPKRPPELPPTDTIQPPDVKDNSYIFEKFAALSEELKELKKEVHSKKLVAESRTVSVQTDPMQHLCQRCMGPISTSQPFRDRSHVPRSSNFHKSAPGISVPPPQKSPDENTPVFSTSIAMQPRMSVRKPRAPEPAPPQPLPPSAPIRNDTSIQENRYPMPERIVNSAPLLNLNVEPRGPQFSPVDLHEMPCSSGGLHPPSLPLPPNAMGMPPDFPTPLPRNTSGPSGMQPYLDCPQIPIPPEAIHPIFEPEPMGRNISIVQNTVQVGPKSKHASKPPYPLDYQLKSHQCFGDEFLIDLLDHVSSVSGFNWPNPQFCKRGALVEDALKYCTTSLRAKEDVKDQVLVFIGCNDMLLNRPASTIISKYSQLIGFLRKRCYHLLLVEPPPLPQLQQSETYWKTAQALSDFLCKCSTNNVRVAFCAKYFLSPDKQIDLQFYKNPLQLNSDGMKILTDEIHRVLSSVRSKEANPNIFRSILKRA